MEKENQIILGPRRYQTFSQVRWRASNELNLGRVSPFLQDSLDLISPPQFVACVMAVGLFDVRNITISKKKVPLPSKNSFSAYGLCCQGKGPIRMQPGAAHARNEAQGMRRHIPLELVEKTIGKNHVQNQSLLARGVGRGGDWRRRACRVPRDEQDARTSIHSCRCCVGIDERYWWKSSPVPDVCELSITAVVHRSYFSGSRKETHPP